MGWRPSMFIALYREYSIYFQCTIEFYFIEWTPNVIFSRVAIVLVFMSEIKFDLTLKKKATTTTKKKILFLLYFYVTIIKLLPNLRHLRREINFFPAISRQFGLVVRLYTVCRKISNSNSKNGLPLKRLSQLEHTFFFIFRRKKHHENIPM